MLSADVLARSVRTLPPLPSAAAQLLAHLQLPGAGLEGAIEIVEREPALAANALRLANSVAYTGLRRADDIRAAAMRIGMEGFRELASSRLMSAVTGGNASALLGYGITRAAFVTHSLAVASFAREVANLIDRRWSAQAYTAGLLHDVGKLVVDTVLRNHRAILERALVRQRDLEDMESEILGITHGDIGAALLHHWRLPEPICAAVAAHHQKNADTLGVIVAIADSLAHHYGYHAGGHRVPLEHVVNDAALAPLQRRPAAIMACAELARSRVSQAALRCAEMVWT